VLELLVEAVFGEETGQVVLVYEPVERVVERDLHRVAGELEHGIAEEDPGPPPRASTRLLKLRR
jgi:hypothetical protein